MLKFVKMIQVDKDDKVIDDALFVNLHEVLYIKFQDPKHKGKRNLVRFKTGDAIHVMDGPETFRKGGIAFEQ